MNSKVSPAIKALKVPRALHLDIMNSLRFDASATSAQLLPHQLRSCAGN
jgi:hypothetical protein